MAHANRLDRLATFCGCNYRRILLAVLLLGLLLRIGAYFDLRATDPAFFDPQLDSHHFIQWAEEIASGNILGDKVFFLNPLYPYFMAPIRVVAGEDSFLLVLRIVQVLLGLGTVVLLAGATRRLAGPGTALLAAIIGATYPLLLYYEQRVMIVTLAVFLNALTLNFLARFADRKTLGSAAQSVFR